MSFGSPKAGAHHSGNQVRQGYKAARGRRSQKHYCAVCKKMVTSAHFRQHRSHLTQESKSDG